MQDYRKTLRQQLRKQRRELSEHDQHRHAVAATRLLARLSSFRSARRVALYLAEDGELDTAHMIERAWRCKKQVYLPVLPPTGHALVFAPYLPNSKMLPNRFGIDEPQVNPKHWISARQLNLILLPLVAFDTMGNRMGMGGGFYDRSLAFMKHQKQWHSPHLIGLAHELQKVDALKCEPWDIPLHQIITEQAVYRGRK